MTQLLNLRIMLIESYMGNSTIVSTIIELHDAKNTCY
jgi:hypothetical protein